MSGLVVDVADLVGRPGRGKEIHRAAAVPGLRTALGWVDDDAEVRLDLAIDSVTEGVAVTGSVSGTMHLSCSRCL
ncbi:MAG: YceD family protein, partial [Actinomycetota bacterium]